MRLRRAAIAAFIALAVMVPGASAVVVSDNFYFQGFEADTTGWMTAGGTVTRVASGTNGIASKTGGFHAEVTGAFTNWGGYGFNPGCTASGCAAASFPALGYDTSVSVYLDVDGGYANDTRFDFSSAISTPAGLHRRDFIFSGGFYNDTTSAGAPGNRFMFTVSNTTPGWPVNPARDPFAIYESGWYTLLSQFRDDGTGVLAVHMSILDADGTVLKTWILSDASDTINGTVGGNRYGWYINIAFPRKFPFLAIDDSRLDVLVDLPEPANKEDCKKGGWMSFFRSDGSSFKNQGDCIQYVNTGK